MEGKKLKGALFNQIPLVKKSSEQFFLLLSIAYLEGPPLAFADIDGNIAGEMARKSFSPIKSVRNALQPSSQHY